METIKKIMNIKDMSSLLKDLHLAIFVMNIAGCGIIYQYLLASYSGRVIGSMEIAIFFTMTLMILFMGLGSFVVKRFDNKFFSFSVLESLIALVATLTIYFISGANALSNMLPTLISETFGIPLDFALEHGAVSSIQFVLERISYVMAALLGFLLGMEIPFLAAIREKVHEGKELNNNIGVIYGVDYLGAGIGAFIWIFCLIKLELGDALKYVAYTNVLVGFFFILAFKKDIKKVKSAMFVQVFTGVFLFFACGNITNWQEILQQSMFRDNIVYSKNTKFQNFVVTKGHNKENDENIYSLFINGKTQFSSSDEGMYHSLLVYPPMTAALKTDNVLVIGGGDGLATRDILKFSPKNVTIVDLDKELIDFFRKPVYGKDGSQVNLNFILLNENAFNDERVNFVFGDAYTNIEKMVYKNKQFDVIIVDLPDPSHPDLNKLYSKRFYSMLRELLTDGGAISIQSSSPYSSKSAFISIGKTLEASGFYTQQYQHNIPSFYGQWGWTIGTKYLPYAKERLSRIEKLPVYDEWLNKEKMLSTFSFGENYYKNIDKVKVNTVDNNATYNYYRQAWESLSKSAFE